jgi:PAS domain S-box-containing protein
LAGMIRERERAEERLRKAEERYRTLVEQLPAMTYIDPADDSDTSLYTSPQVEQMLGYTPEEWQKNRMWPKRLHPDDRERVLAADERFERGGETFSEEYRLIHRDGRIVWVREDAVVVRDEVGEPVYWQGVIFDITERKEAEEALRRSEASLAEAQRIAHLGSWEWDVRTGEVLWSDEVYRIYGYEPKEFVPTLERLMESVHPDDRELLKEKIDAALYEGEPYDFNHRVVLPTGEERIVNRRADVVRGEEGEPLYMVGTVQDITERKQAEERLRQAETRYRTLVERMPAVTYIQEIGSPDAAMYMSPRIETLTGYSPEDCRDPDLRWRMVHPDDRERMQAEDERTGEPGEVFTTEYRVVHRDGRVVWVRNEAVMVEDESGSRYWQGFMLDITERKRAEEEMQKAREAAEEANRAKSAFLANMSHEIRTPMNGVIGMAELLLDTELSPEQREYAAMVRASGEKLLTIINDILDFSKIEAGRMDFETIDFDLRTAVEETVGLLAERTYAKGLELASSIEPDVPTALRGDPGRLSQVLTNLLGNAVKFTEEGEVVLRVGLVEETEGSAVVRFEVQDTGIGMTQEQRSRLFQSFSQADATTTRRYGGTGLGLAISKQLVEMMGGEIDVESEPGKGSTFWFTVPFEKQPEGARATPSPHADLRNLRVLVVDDNETNRKIVGEQIASWGMGYGLVEDGEGALKVLRSAAKRGEPYDLALVDLNMPKMDGMELAHRIKADPSISSTQLVLLTSLGLRGEAEQAKRVGFSAYLAKPMRQSQLYDAIATVMNLPLREASAPEPPIVTRHSLEEAKAHTRERLWRAYVLVAEDNAVNQRVAVRLLERLGYRADVAANGLEALEALSHIPYAAILMDVQMPEMDGYEATAVIRRREKIQGRRTPIIAMTANAMQGDREKALGAGMDDYIPKPVKPKELKAVLERWIPQQGPSKLEMPATVLDADPTIPDEAEAPLDESVLESLRELQGEGEPDILRELIALFLDDIPPQLAALREAIAGDDAHSVERIAHTLKGSSGNMGAKRMVAICSELQDVGASGNLSNAPELLERLGGEFGRVRTALEAEIARS